MQHQKICRKGFTLVEMITVVAIVGILALVAAPSVANFVASGQQQSRSNIARTLYVAAQNRLTELQVTKALRPTLTDRYYAADNTPNDLDRLDAASALGSNFPATDAANAPYVRYITKAAGDTDPTHPVNILLAPVVVDTSILDNAICIEYNIQTGVVLSVFYSDVVDKLVYSDTVDNANLIGERPYTHAADRKQGYYGVDNTGVTAPTDLPDVVEIYDGATKPVESGRDNLLYAEIYLPRAVADKQRTIAITDTAKKPLSLYQLDINFATVAGDAFVDTLDEAVAKAGLDSSKHILYCASSTAVPGSVVQYGVDISASYERYIWVLDYVDGDQINNGIPHNIQTKYKDGKQTADPADDVAIGAQDLRVSVQRTAADKPVVSLSKANALYLAQTGLPGSNRYTVATARHLSNIRHNPGNAYYQTQTIRLGAITNFEPLPTFTGEYVAKGGSDTLRVTGLVIDTTGLTTQKASVGLFTEIDTTGSVLGLSLENATITAQNSSNVGSIAGVLKGKLRLSNSFANVTATNRSANVGGLVGSNSGQIKQSYNGGYYDATGRTPAPYYGSVSSSGGGNVGGLVGLNAGTVESSYNNARVNVQSVTVTDTGTEQYLSQNPVFTKLDSSASGNFGGLVGQQASGGKLVNCYTTNFVASYSSPSRSGGIVGDNLGGTGTGTPNCYYLSNGLSNAGAKSKTDLRTVYGSSGAIFKLGAAYNQQKNDKDNYPYPVLSDNVHLTGYEDIWEKSVMSTVRLQYYEVYQDPDKKPTDPDNLLWGFQTPDGSSSLRQDLLAVSDGYCIDFGYGNSYTFSIASGATTRSFTLNDTRNNPDNPQWEWAAGSSSIPDSLPVAYKTTDGTTRYRLFFRNYDIESFAKPNSNTSLQFTATSRSVVLDRQSFSPYFAASFGSALKNYTVRTPRQLDNIDRIAITRANQPPEVYDSKFTQTLDIDFAVYYKELTLDNPDGIVTLDRTTRLAQQGSIVDAVFNGSYDGQHHFVRHMELQAGTEDTSYDPDADPSTNPPGDNAQLSGRGLFAEVGTTGSVERLALLRSSVAGAKRSLGGIAGVLQDGGRIAECELSEVTVHDSGNGNSFIGGVVGKNQGTLQDVYFNSTNRDSTGLYATPITGSKNAGGLVGHNTGNLRRCYTTALAPGNSPIVGNGSLKDGSTAYYLSALGYNNFENLPKNQGEPIGPEPSQWRDAFVGKEPDIWELSANVHTTKDTELCAGIPYSYPKLKGTDHYYDWPILATLLKYYERYDDLSYGYYYYINQYAAVDTLRYDPERTVIEEGYLVSTLTDDNYDLLLTSADGRTNVSLTNQSSLLMDGQRVIKLLHRDVESLSSITASGVLYVKAEASARVDKNGDRVVDEKDFTNELAGLDPEGFVWFNPRFARAIALTEKGTAANPPAAPKETALTVRSPRHLLQIEANAALKTNAYSYNQTCSINMAGATTIETGNGTFRTLGYYDKVNTPTWVASEYGADAVWAVLPSTSGRLEAATVTLTEVLSDRTIVTTYEIQLMDYDTVVVAATTDKYTRLTTVYDNSGTLYSTKQDYIDADIGKRPTFPPVDNHLITGTFNATYNGQYAGSWSGKLQSDTKRLGGYRINNLVMHADTEVAGMFQLIGEKGRVSNLELVDIQMRSDTGLGGGALAATCSGQVTNIRVWHTTPTYLFAGADGTANNSYCSIQQDHERTTKNGYRHVHGGLVGHLTGATALVSQCVVGTSDSTLEQVVENNTQIACFTAKLLWNGTQDQTERAMIPMGGIVGQADYQATIMSCTNIATITCDTSKGFGGDAPWQMGGIVGRLGLYRWDDNAVSESASVYGCYNAGSVRTSAGWSGGVAGRANGNASIVSCYNTGRVNVYTDANGELKKTSPQAAIRIAGILAESNEIRWPRTGTATKVSYPSVSACYNIGYVSDVSGASRESRSGAIIGLPGFGNVTMTSSFSLKANQYAPVGITGASYGGGMVNGQTKLDIFATWESRAAMRNQPELLTRRTTNTATAVHLNNINLYPFTPSRSSFYIFPEFMGSSYGGLTIPSNQHFTPWEYIDAVYDTTLKYYEKYSDNSYGYYYLDMSGKAIDTLAGNKDAADSAKVVVEDGYLLELGETGWYDVKINDQTFTVEAKVGLPGDAGRIGLTFTEEMVKACKPGYNRIQFFTRLVDKLGDTEQNREDDMLNRIIGSTSATNLEGIDLYFDYSFPKELRYGTIKIEGDVTTGVPPVLEANHNYEIRSIRHLIGIGTLTQATGNPSTGKVFTQTRELAADSYQYVVGAPAGYTKTPALANATYPGVLVQGGFAGRYDGSNHAITGLRLQGAADAAAVGIFAQNNGTITRLLLQSPTVTSLAGSGTGLVMGTVATVNSGTVSSVALYQPMVVGSANADSQIVGGVVGVNDAKGILTDLLLVSDAAGSPVGNDGNPAGGTLGGMVGSNKGTVTYSIYLAPAPGTNPIVGENVGGGAAKTSVFYLGGRGYNQFDPGENAGSPKSTAQFAAVVDVLSRSWGQPAGSPYPWLLSMPAPTRLPSPVEGLAYTLAYYEQYEDNSYRWYYNEDDVWVDKLDATNSARIIAQGYAALLRDDPDTNPLTSQDAYDPDTSYTVRFGSHTVSLPAGGHTGLVVGMTTDSGKTYQAVLQSSAVPADSAEPLLATINGFEMQNSNSYFNPGFAKAIGSSPTNITTVSVRNEQHLLNLSALLENMRGVPAIKQERSLDLSKVNGGNPLTASVVNAALSGSYDGGYQAKLADGSTNPNPIVIHNLGINYIPDPADAAAVNLPVGLFRESFGTIQNLYLTGTVSVQGSNNVGAIVGINQTNGIVTDCIINAQTAVGDLLVKGEDNVGGVTGLNAGTIQNITITGGATDATTGNIVGVTTTVGGIAGTNAENSNMHKSLRVENVCIEAVQPTAADDRFDKGVGINSAADSNLSVSDVMYNCFFKAVPITIRLFSNVTPFATTELAAPDANGVVEQELSAQLPKNSSAGISALNRLGTSGLTALDRLRSILLPGISGLSPFGSSDLSHFFYPSGASGLSGLPALDEAGRLLAPRDITFALSSLPPGYSLADINIIEPGEHYLRYARYPQINGCIFTAEFTDILIQFSLVPEDESEPTYQYSILLNLTEP